MRLVAAKARPAPLNVGTVDTRLPATTPAEQTFERLYREAIPEAMAHALYYLPREQAWDAVQQTALELFAKWDSLPLKSRTVAFFLKAVHYRVMDELREESWQDYAEVELDDHIIAGRANADDDDEVNDDEGEEPPQSPLVNGELVYPEFEPRSRMVGESAAQHELVERIIMSFPPQVRQVWVLTRRQGLSDEEAAEFMGITPATVRKHRSRAYALIRAAVLRSGLKLTKAGMRALMAPNTEVDYV